MRFLALLLLVLTLGLSAWYLLGGFDGDPAGVPLAGDAEETDTPPPDDERLRARFGLKTGTLAIQVRTVDGQRPMLAEVGYLLPGGRARWLGAQGGARVITDAPLGTVTAIARAPGYPRVEQPCQVVAGVRADVVITLRPGSGPPDEPARSPSGG